MHRRAALGLAVAAGAALVGGTAAGAALTGCTGDPAVRGPSPAPVPSPSPPDPDVVAAVAGELGLAHQARTLGALTSSDGRRTRAARLAAAHTAHAIALAGPDPTSRTSPTPTSSASAPASPSVAPSRLPALGDDVAVAVRRLRKQEAEAAARYRDRAVGPGSDALLWASLHVAAATSGAAVAATSPPPAAPGTATAPLPRLAPVAAAQQLLGQVHAVRYAYRQALAALSGDVRARAEDALADRTRLRDRLEELLRAAGADVPAAEPAYTVPVRPDTAARARRLLRTVDLAVLPYVGLWLAADPQQRTHALDALTRSAASAVAWGSGPLTWPGYP